MKIHNLRLGFACNSSSSHSLIFLPNCRGDVVEEQNYGWNCFTLSSAEEKMGYLGQQIVASLFQQLGEEPARALAVAITGTNLNKDGDVDHQSVWTLPRTWDGNNVNTDFLYALKDYLKREEIVILGGNDNDGEHPYVSFNEETQESNNFSIFGSWVDGTGDLISRYDEGLRVWILFDRNTGSKIRLSFDTPDGMPKISHVDISKASRPELVDIKITDRCPYECKHCYQGSTRDASHANAQFLNKIIQDLAKSQVFEIAYGGGEPTVYPNFIELLETTRSNNIIPNFTTRNLTWVHKNISKISKIIGKIAFSVDFEEEIDKLEKYLIEFNKEKNNIFHITKENNFNSLICIQHVVGTVSQTQFERLLDLVKNHYLDITLLGWKLTGRGSDIPQHNIDWLSSLKEKEIYKIAIDTALARSSDMANIDKRTYHTTEGSVSCYIDAVNQKIGPSSYANSLTMKTYSDINEDWKKIRVEHGFIEKI
jgi:MoaA/NifB/PqqE/SkfB family radical SAM enzyme